MSIAFARPRRTRADANYIPGKIDFSMPFGYDHNETVRKMLAYMRSFGLVRVKQEDTRPIQARGDCQFESISRIINPMFGTNKSANDVRAEITDYMKQHSYRYREFYETQRELDAYLEKMSVPREYGDAVTLQAAADLYEVVFVTISTTNRGKTHVLFSYPQNSETPGVFAVLFFQNSHYQTTPFPEDSFIDEKDYQ